MPDPESKVNANAVMMSDQGARFEVGSMRADEAPLVAQMHFDFFGVGEMHRHSIANFGPAFLERLFYRLNLDNPYFFVDVARYNGKVIAFSAYTSDRQRVFRYMLRKHFFAIAWQMFALFV